MLLNKAETCSAWEWVPSVATLTLPLSSRYLNKREVIRIPKLNSRPWRGGDESHCSSEIINPVGYVDHRATPTEIAYLGISNEVANRKSANARNLLHALIVQI